ncbi:MAG: bifunctional folylpolyglutamate synthase/dihydrofolate synthase [Gammaproteobacteria bacterium]|nr:bifunctional folylpolyglutamate synthase/dihydrofolate synthase [Gammaproteobacteria bacterium]
MTVSTLADWLARIEQLHPENIELGLDRIGCVHRQLGLPKPATTVISIAGTNGKGSVIRALQVLLEHAAPGAAAPRAGVYTSPHLLRFNERICIGGQSVCDATLVQAFERVERARRAAGESAGAELKLTYFEFTTLAALCIFTDAALDYVLLEVGLGGRLDAVNLVDADLALITNIALDHEHWLGSTREAIGAEKAGILRPGADCVIGDPDPPRSLFDAVQTDAAQAYWAAGEHAPVAGHKHSLLATDSGFEWFGVDSSGNAIRYAGLPEPQLAAENWSTAMQAAALLDALPDRAVCAELMASVSITGRFSSHRYRGKPVQLDVAHNPAAVARLAQMLQDQPGRPIYMIFAALADKRVDAMLQQLIPLVDHWIFPQLRNCPRALDADKMLQNFHAQGGNAKAGEAGGSVQDALQKLSAGRPDGACLCVSGSFFTVAEALELIEREQTFE